MQEEKNILEIDGVEVEDNSKDIITLPFDPKKIDIATKRMILEAIFRRLRENDGLRGQSRKFMTMLVNKLPGAFNCNRETRDLVRRRKPWME